MKRQGGVIFRMLLGTLFVILATGLLAGSIWMVYRFLKTGISVTEGMGWGRTGEEEAKVWECCEALESYLASREQWPEEGLLYNSREEAWAEEILAELSAVAEERLLGETWLLYRKLIYCMEIRARGERLPDYEALLSEFGGTLQKIREEYYILDSDERENAEYYAKWLERQAQILDETADRLKGQQTLEGFYSADSIAKAKLLGEELKTCFLEGEQSAGEKAMQAWQKMEAVLEETEGAEYGRGLCHYPGGAAYYDYLLEKNTGSGMDAEEMYRYLDRYREEITREEAVEGPKLQGDIVLQEVQNLDGMALADDLLSQLYRHTIQKYPGADGVSWNLEELPDSFYGKISKAFYFKKGEQNKIYVSDCLAEEDIMTIYQIMAHEGFPGHTYSYNVKREEPYPNLARTLVFPGYAEGWAVWAELAAAEWLAEAGERYRKMVSDNLFDEIVLSQMDIGIHGLGWSMEELDQFVIQVYGAQSKGIASRLWNTLADNPCLYQPYTVGYLKLVELEETCRKQGKDRQTFVDLYQQCGQAPFSVAEEWFRR